MRFLRPEAAWLLSVLAVPIILYLLPLPRRRKTVPSTQLWRLVVGQKGLTARHRFWRVLASILLASTILILVIGAYGRWLPDSPRQIDSDAIVVIVLDNSASMQTTRLGLSRFDRALSRATTIAESVPTGARLALVTTAPSPGLPVRVTEHPEAVVDRLRNMRASEFSGSVDRALWWLKDALADEKLTVHVLTDGAEEQHDADGLTGTDVTWHRFGTVTANAGIVAFGARRVEVPTSAVIVCARLGNYSNVAGTVDLTLSVNSASLKPRSVKIPPDSETTVSWVLPALSKARLELEMTPHDSFTLDDRAGAVIQPVEQKRVILVAEKPPVHLLSALRADSRLKVFLLTPEKYRRDIGADITIFVDKVPMAIGSGNVMLVNPSGSNVLVEVSGGQTSPGELEVDALHPILANLSLRPGLIRSASTVKTPAWAEAVITGAGGPLVLCGRQDDRRAVVLTFDPENQPISRTRVLPVLIRNIISYLAPVDPSFGLDDDRAPSAGLLSAAESSLSPKGEELSGTALTSPWQTPAFLWTMMIVFAILFLVVEGWLYHRRFVE